MNENELLSIGEVAELLDVSLDTIRRWDKQGYLPSVRLTSKSPRKYLKNEVINFLIEKLKANSIAKNWAQSQFSMELPSSFYCPTRDVFTGRLLRMEKELSNYLNEDEISLLTAIIGEMGNNSFDHNLGNWRDMPGIFFVYDLSNRQIILADRGQGIFKTLKRVQPELKDDTEALEIAFTKIISGRAPETRGNGLKFVKQIICETDFKLFFQSGRAKLELKKGDLNLNIKKVEKAVGGCIAIVDF